ncbi:MAG: hypothetical protein AXW17_03340 [Colwellia sp. Phe_37]|jgi:hypothetical protein|nr:MAG: hypothetical protein AXW17_03340 [Colwellia sp. Phe_37]|tara:strand:- start:68195 stop:68506 length:312 start_codon:yes stop_codon:yes gene_type:complete
MFKYYSLKKYSKKLLPALEKRYGKAKYYSASQVRATIYQHDFNPKYLPLAYLLFLDKSSLKNVIYIEFPELNMAQYKQEICQYLARKQSDMYLKDLHALVIDD